MAKGYWVSCYRAVHDPAKLGESAKLAGPAIQQHGGRLTIQRTTNRDRDAPAHCLERQIVTQLRSHAASHYRMSNT